jgi:hypothetical protein
MHVAGHVVIEVAAYLLAPQREGDCKEEEGSAAGQGDDSFDDD